MKLIGCILTTLVCQILAEEGSTADPPKCLPGTWVPASNGDYPRDALAIGGDGGRIAYLIRAIHNGRAILGNLYDGVAYVARDGSEHKYSNYEVFCGKDDDYRWQANKGGPFPLNAMIVGKNSLSKPIYACRGIVNNIYSAGELINGLCYVGNSLHDYWLTEYDILVEGTYNLPGCVPGTWESHMYGDYPRGGLPVGFDHGQLVYLIRGKYDGELMPGRLEGGRAYLPYYGQARMVPYEVFCGGYGNFFLWKPYSGGRIPSTAVIAAENSSTGPIYACRGIARDSNYSAGKVVEKKDGRFCHVPYEYFEIALEEYDILVEDQ